MLSFSLGITIDSDRFRISLFFSMRAVSFFLVSFLRHHKHDLDRQFSSLLLNSIVMAKSLGAKQKTVASVQRTFPDFHALKYVLAEPEASLPGKTPILTDTRYASHPREKWTENCLPRMAANLILSVMSGRDSRAVRGSR